MSKEKICFVISPIGSEDSPTRRRSDQVFNHIISPVVKKYGYEPIRADQISEPGIITSQIIQCVVDSPLVIADLTGRNPNVYYELAIRHAIRLPLIQLINKEEQIPFDVAATRTIFFDVTDLDSVANAMKQLEAQIVSVEEEEFQIDTPISTALDLKIFRESGKPQDLALADIVENMSSIGQRMSSIEEHIRSPDKLLPPDYFEYLMRNLPSIQISTREKDIIRDIQGLNGEIIEQIDRLNGAKELTPQLDNILRLLTIERSKILQLRQVLEQVNPS